MKKVLAGTVILGLMLGGCAEQMTTKGTRTTVRMAADGVTPVSAITEEAAVGDVATETNITVREVARSSAEVVKARADAIAKATAPGAKDSGEVAAWKGAFGALAVAMIDDKTAQNIAAVPKHTTGFDVLNNAVGVVGGVANTGIIGMTVSKVVDKVMDGAGDKVTNNINGDGNSQTVETAKTNINNENTSTTSGDESPATATSTPTAGGTSSGGTSSGSEEGSSSLQKAWSTCASEDKTQGEVAGCLKLQGQDVNITGGITYVGGEAYDFINNYDYAEPKK